MLGGIFMGIIIIAWAAIVTTLTNQTHVYQKCKNVKCEVEIQEIGYKIIEVKDAE